MGDICHAQRFARKAPRMMVSVCNLRYFFVGSGNFCFFLTLLSASNWPKMGADFVKNFFYLDWKDLHLSRQKLLALTAVLLLLSELKPPMLANAVISSHYDEGEHMFTVQRMHKLQQQQKQQQTQEVSSVWPPPQTSKLGYPPPPPPIPPTQTPYPSSNIDPSSSSDSSSASYNTYPYNSYYYYESNNNNNNDGSPPSASNDFLEGNMLPEHQNPYAFRPHPGFGTASHHHRHHHGANTDHQQQASPAAAGEGHETPPLAGGSQQEHGIRRRNVTSEWLGEHFWQNLASLQIAYNTDPVCVPTSNIHQQQQPHSPYLLINSSSPAYRVCEAKSHKRRAVLKSVRLDFCNHWSLAHVFGHNDECILRPSSSHDEYAETNGYDQNNNFAHSTAHDPHSEGSSDCRECVQSALAADEAARKAWCYFNHNILGRFDCQTQNSVVWDCDGCREAYKLWICAMIIPFHKREYVIRPCRTFCRWVEQRCPYIAPEEKNHQYGAEPAFRCRDPGIPELFSIYAPEPWCYLPCHLDHSLGPEGACKKVRLQYSQLAEYYNVTNLIRQKQVGAESVAAGLPTDFETEYTNQHQVDDSGGGGSHHDAEKDR